MGTIIQYVFYLAVLVLLAIPLGRYISKAMNGEKAFLQGHSTTNKKIAEQNHCYKMMLLTGSKEESTLNFYRNAGYNSSDKTAFIQWIN